MARVVHFEIPASDPERSRRFYGNVFGWQFNQLRQEPYWIAKTGDESSPGINGAIMQRRDPKQPLTNHIQVDNLEKSMAEIEAQGGQIVVEKMIIPEVGYLAFFKDPDGNILGITQADEEAG